MRPDVTLRGKDKVSLLTSSPDNVKIPGALVQPNTLPFHFTGIECLNSIFISITHDT